VFAIDHFFFGVTNPDGAPNLTGGWKNYGIDLDHRASTASSGDLCIPSSGAPAKNVYPDGPEGIDNSWGKNILSIQNAIDSAFEQNQNDAIAEGGGSLLLSIGGLGSQQSYNPLDACAYQGAALKSPPKFDGTDTWPVAAASLSNPADITSCKGHFPSSYVVGDVWVSGPSAGALAIAAPSTSGLGSTLIIHQPVIYATLSADRTKLTGGIIAGVLSLDEVSADLKKTAGGFDPSLCSGSTIDSILAQIAQASDILADGSQDPTKVCTGISIGLGFTAKAVTLGDIAPEPTPTPDPCAMP
jgi:hypothetical protein